MRFLRRQPDAQDELSQDGTDGTAVESAEEQSRAQTPAKGKPTPKRRDAEGRRRGPVAPPPKTQREAYKRARGNKSERRQAAAERRERMMAGDDRYLMPRDRGPVRAHVRDVVDSRRHLMGLFMPAVLVVFALTLVRNLVVQQYASLACFALLLAMIVEGVLLGRLVVRQVREKFPKSEEKAFTLGWYAFSRGMQLRRLRVPRPRVSPKNPVQAE